METHLVTGATGLVGMHIVFDLLSQNKKVCATFTKNSNRNIIKNVFNHYGFSKNYDKINWIKNNPVKCDKIVKNAKKEFIKKYTAEENYNQLLKIYKKTINAK